MNATSVRPEQVLKDLNALWAEKAREEADHGGILRACALTLIVAAEDEADALRARETIGLLMREHPSRAILVQPGGSSELDARVFAECWRPFGKTEQICSEGIEILPGAAGLEEVARFIVPLLVPDLPVVLWRRGMDAARYSPLFRLATKIIFDSREAIDCDETLRTLRRLHAYGYRVADLHWARITGWRELIASLFDSGLRAQDLQAVQVGYGGGAISTCARYFDAWVRTVLPAVNVTVTKEAGVPGLNTVRLLTRAGELSIVRGADHTFEVSGLGRNFRSPAPSTTEEALMREELSILSQDPVYERVLTA